MIILFLMLLLIALMMVKGRRQLKKKWWKHPLGWVFILLLAMIIFSRSGLVWLGMLGGALWFGLMILIKMVQLLQNIHGLTHLFMHNRGHRGASQQSQARQERTVADTQIITIEDAYRILGITPKASKDEILLAHRRLIAKCHPDQGGSDYLAQQINQARDVLLKS